MESLLLFIACCAAAALNAIAGGGTFLAFPTLLWLGVPSIPANATCTIAIWPGSLASMLAYRQRVVLPRGKMLAMLIIAIVGGWCGAQLLLHLESSQFDACVPWLLLSATLILAYGKKVAAWFHRAGRMPQALAWGMLVTTALYGGFFGAGIGILLLAMLYMTGLEDLHEMNALKVVLAAGMNASAFFTFLFSDVVAWDYAPPMIAGALLGGYMGAKMGLRIPQQQLKKMVLCIAIVSTVYFFVDFYA
jgi:uncharacterized protein